MFRRLTEIRFGKGYPFKVALTAFGSWLSFFILVLALTSCKKEFYPKPKAYPRISYPEANYQSSKLADSLVSFEYPTYTSLETQTGTKNNWINIRFKPFGATLFMSMIQVTSLEIEDMIRAKEKLAIEQAPLSSEVRKEEFEASDHRLTAYFYLTDGNTPCPVQFILSNHQDKLFQGSLVFDDIINRDSLASVVEGLTRDVRHLVETFQFKP